MTHRNARSTRLARALVVLPTALCVSGVVVAAEHQDHPAGFRAVGDPMPSPSPSPAVPSPSVATPIAGATIPAALVIDSASVTRVRPGQAVTTAPTLFAARKAATVGDTATDAVSGIGTTALGAYQRAAAVVDQADTACRLDWTLLAAIGEVESGHGTYGGSVLDAAGVATPAIEGPVLDGRHHTRMIADTDGGRLDHDTRYDRALGPMQILPSTWLQIAVDGDGDGRRDPQDINDASLAAAVYLCSGGDDLATPAGARAAVLRYNRSETYADTVLALAAGYQQGTVVPAGLLGVVTGAGGVVSAVDAQPVEVKKPKHQHTRTHPAKHHAATAAHHPSKHAGQHAAVASPPVSGGPAPAAPSTPAKPTSKPTAGSTPTAPATPGAPTSGPPSGTPATTREDVCREAIEKTYPSASDDAVTAAVDACVTALAGLGNDQAQAALPDLLATLPDTIADLGPAAAPVTTEPTDTPSPTAQESVAP